MSESIATIRNQLWEKMRAKSYRDTFVAAHLSTNIAAQIQTLREMRGWSQKDLAEKSEMSPSRISVMEDPAYEKFTLTTLKRLASAFDVALVTRFTKFSELVNWVSDLSPEKLAVPNFENDAVQQDGFGEATSVSTNQNITIGTGKLGLTTSPLIVTTFEQMQPTNRHGAQLATPVAGPQRRELISTGTAPLSGMGSITQSHPITLNAAREAA